MNTRIDITREKEIYLEVELLNQACLDLVGQIEQLEKENARLKIKAQEINGFQANPNCRIIRNKD
jgi:hypothetical protein